MSKSAKLTLITVLLTIYAVSFYLAFLADNVLAATGINDTINFQGKVVNADGTNVADGNYDFDFAIYTVDSGGAAIWTESWDSGTAQVTVTDGIFRVALGTHTDLPGSIDFNTDNIYLGITFNNDAAGEMTPRVRFAAVPYAFNAQKVAGLTVTDTTGTLTVSNDKTLTVSDSTTLATNSITFGGTQSLTLAAAKNVSFADSFTTSGANPLTLTTTGTTNVTLPTSGTLFSTETTSAQGDIIYASANNTLGLLNKGSDGECLKATTTTIQWGVCAENGSLFTDDGTFTYLTATVDDLVLGASTVADAAFYMQITDGGSPAYSTLFLGTNESKNGRLTFYSSGVSETDPSVYTNANGDLVLSAPTGTVEIGTTSGDIELSLLTLNDNFIADKTITLTGAYNQNDFTFKRVLTSNAVGETQGGAVLYIEDSGDGTGTTVDGGLLVVNSNLSAGTFTGNLLDLQVGGSSVASIDANGALTVSSCTGCGGGGGALHQITAATASQAGINSGTNSIVWNWALDGSDAAFTFGENSASTGAGNSILNVSTLASSTATALTVNSFGEDTAYALRVNDVSADSSPFVITNLGRVGVGIADPSSLFTVGADLFLVDSSGNTTLQDQADLRFGDSDGSNWVAFQAPSTVNTDVTWTLPAADASGCLQSNGSGTISIESCGGPGSTAWSGIGAPIGSLSLTFDDGEVSTFNSGSDTETFWNMTGNSMTTGKMFSLTSSSASLSTGNLLHSSYTGTAAFTGNLNHLEYAPGSTPATSPTGDLLRLSLGANATNFAGNYLNLVNNSGTSIFSVSDSQFSTSLPTNFTASGDVAVSYDINFTNPTASYIKSAAPLYLVAGETFNSSDLVLQTYNSGSIVLETGSASSIVQMLTGNLSVGNGTPSVISLNGENAYIEGNLEIDGTVVNMANAALTVASCTGCSGGSALSSVTAATTSDTDNDNLNNDILWDWSTLTTQTAFTLSGGSAITSGSVLGLTGNTFVHTALNDTGQVLNLTFTDSSTNTNNGGTTSGISIVPTINTSGAGTKTVNGLNIAPTQTGCSGGACTVNGINVANVTDGTGFTSSGLTVGTGWDSEITLNDTTSIIKLGATDDTASLSFMDSSGTSLLDTIMKITDFASSFGGLIESGGFLSHNSYLSQEFNSDTASTTTANVNAGDDASWTNNNAAAADCTWVGNDQAGGYLSQTTAASGDGCSTTFGSANNNLATIFDADNEPIYQAKVRVNQVGANYDNFIGFFDKATPTAAETKPTNGIYFYTNNGTDWLGEVKTGASVSTTGSCGAVVTGAWAIFRIEVRSTTDVRFYVDTDISNGITLTQCTSGTLTTNVPTGLLGVGFDQTQTTANPDLTMDMEYVRIWQDDPVGVANEQVSASVEGQINDDGELVSQEEIESTKQLLETNEVSDVEAVTSRVQELETKIEELSASHSAELAILKNKTNQLEATSSSRAISQDDLLVNLMNGNLSTVSGTLNVDSLRVKNDAIFAGVVQFLESISARMLVVTEFAEFLGKVIFKDNVEILGTLTVNNDAAGTAVIKPGATEVEITFEKEYETVPQVTATVNLDQTISEEDMALLSPQELIEKQNAQNLLEQELLNAEFNFIIARKSTKGFVIKLSKPIQTELIFSWHAQLVKDAKIFTSKEDDLQTIPNNESISEEQSGVMKEQKPLEQEIQPQEQRVLSTTTKPTEIVVKETETGFLRVRKEPKTSSEEIGQLKPGWHFTTVETTTGLGGMTWYKIKFEQEKYGWVKGIYVTVADQLEKE